MGVTPFTYDQWRRALEYTYSAADAAYLADQFTSEESNAFGTNRETLALLYFVDPECSRVLDEFLPKLDAPSREAIAREVDRLEHQGLRRR